ncbi:MAG: hypothetical protein LBP58_07025, partial [Azoarcus sp.]|nr:hypothetical protein [Azoarcus sp.]
SSRYMSLSRCFASCRKMHRGKNEIMIKDCGETLASSLRGSQARGNPHGGSACSNVSGDGSAAWIATSLRFSQ